MTQMFLTFILLISMIATAVTIRCYSCEQLYVANCGEDFESEDYFQMDCSLRNPPRFLQNESELYQSSIACMKQIYKEKGEQRIMRSCFFGDINDTTIGCRLDPTLEDVEEIACHVCDDEDYCNHAAGLQTWPTHLAIGGFILVAKLLQKWQT